MGMYDEINFTCPNCQAIVTNQSKAGDCMLRAYGENEVPLGIAADIEGEKLYCENCETTFTIVKLPDEPTTVKMRLVKS